MWFLDRLAAGDAGAYNVPVVLELAGPLDAEALARRAGGSRRAARGAADAHRGARRPARAAHRRAGAVRASPSPTWRTTSWTRGWTAERAPALRPVAADLPIRARSLPDRRGRARAGPHLPPRGGGRLVHRHPPARAVGAVRGAEGGSRRGAAAAAAAVRGLRGVAARLAARRARWSGRRRTGAARWRARRPCWSCPRTARARREQSFRGALHSFAVPARGERRRLRAFAAAEHVTPFMADAGRVRGAAGPLRGPGRRRRGLAGGGAAPAGVGADRGPVRQHAGAAHGPVRRPRASASWCGASARRRWTRTRTRTCPSSGWWTSCRWTRALDRTPALPGDVLVRRGVRGRLALPGDRRPRAGRAPPHGQVRPDAEPGGGGAAALRATWSTPPTSSTRATAARIGEHYVRLLDRRWRTRTDRSRRWTP